MALSIVELDAYTLKRIIPKTTDVVYKNSPVLTRLRTQRMERFEGGTQIQRPLIIGELNGDAVGRGETFNVDYVTTDTALVLDMKAYYVNITLYGFDSMKNDSELAVFSQVETKFQNAAMKMAKLLATNMYLDAQTAGRTKHLNGFKEWYDDGALFPAVGGITRTDITSTVAAGLNAYVGTLTSFSLQQVNTAYGNAWFGADHPDLIAATQNGYNLFWNALQPLTQYPVQGGSVSDVTAAGFQAFRFNAADVVVDKYMPTGTNGVMFGFNTKYIEWFFSTNPKFQFGWTGFKEQSNSIDVSGQFLVGNQIVVPNPRSGFKLLSTLF